LTAPPIFKMPDSPKTPKRADRDAVAMQLQQFIDAWHYLMVNSKMTKSKDRNWVLSTALDVLEVNGCKFRNKESLLDLDEDTMLMRIVDAMSEDMMDNFDEVASELQKALDTSMRLRAALDAGDEQAVHDKFEMDADTTACKHLLKNAILHAATMASKIRKGHLSWRDNTERRIARLAAASEEAEHALQQVLAIEAQLDNDAESSKERNKGMLMGLASKNDKALMRTVFSSWLGDTMKEKETRRIRDKFKTQLEESERRLYMYKERQLANVRSALGRKCAEDGEGLLAWVLRGWAKEVKSRKEGGDTAKQIEEARARLESFKAEQSDNAKKALLRMNAGSQTGLMTLVWQSWQKHIEDILKDKELNDAVKEAERKLREHMKGKKEDAKNVLERMSAANDNGLRHLVVQKWSELCAEERRARKFQDQIEENRNKFSFFKDRQANNARGVQGRVNEQMRINCMLKMLNHWQIVVKCGSVDAMYTRKLESKRKQLAGVQNLFKTFAQQLEHGINVDGENSSRGNSGRGEHKSSRKHRTMNKGSEGSVSLPDIHSHGRHQHAAY